MNNKSRNVKQQTAAQSQKILKSSKRTTSARKASKLVSKEAPKTPTASVIINKNYISSLRSTKVPKKKPVVDIKHETSSSPTNRTRSPRSPSRHNIATSKSTKQTRLATKPTNKPTTKPTTKPKTKSTTSPTKKLIKSSTTGSLRPKNAEVNVNDKSSRKNRNTKELKVSPRNGRSNKIINELTKSPRSTTRSIGSSPKLSTRSPRKAGFSPHTLKEKKKIASESENKDEQHIAVNATAIASKDSSTNAATICENKEIQVSNAAFIVSTELSEQFQTKLLAFESELLKAKTDYESHIKKLAYQKTVWQKKYFNLLRIKTNDPLLNKLAKKHKKELIASEANQAKNNCDANDNAALSPINEGEEQEEEELKEENEQQNELESALTIETKQQCEKSLQTDWTQDYAEKSVNTDVLESPSPSLNERTLAQETRRVSYHAARLLDEQQQIKNDLNQAKEMMKATYNNMEQLIVDDVNHIWLKMKSHHAKKPTLKSISVNTAKTVFTLTKQNNINIAYVPSKEAWHIGTQTQLTEVDKQSLTFQQFLNTVNNDLSCLKAKSESSCEMKNSQLFLKKLNEKVFQIKNLKNDLNTIKKDTKSAASHFELQFGHLFTSLAAFSKQNKNMNNVIAALRKQHHSQTTNVRGNVGHEEPINFCMADDEINNKNAMKAVSENVDKTLEQIRQLFNNSMSHQDCNGYGHAYDNTDIRRNKEKQMKNKNLKNSDRLSSPVIHNHQFFNFENDFTKSQLTIDTCLDDISNSYDIETEPESKGFSKLSDCDSMFVNASDTIDCDLQLQDYKDEQFNDENSALFSNQFSFVFDAKSVANGIKEYEARLNKKHNNTKPYHGKLQLLQKRIHTNNIVEKKLIKPRLDTPTTSSRSISDDTSFHSPKHDTTLSDMLEEALFTDTTLLKKIDEMDGVLNRLLDGKRIRSGHPYL